MAGYVPIFQVELNTKTTDFFTKLIYTLYIF